jgi:hypothetical protein
MRELGAFLSEVNMRMFQPQNRMLFILGCLLLSGIIYFSSYQMSMADPQNGSATVLSPYQIGGISGFGDQRDADVYPAVAFNPSTDRYLIIWESPRNAGSSSDGFDIYGRFLNRIGQPIGNEFRISDSNTVARNSLPSIVADDLGFVVAWTQRSYYCQISVQRVTDENNRTDEVLVTGSVPNHSPSLEYNPTRHSYVLAYVEGDDYLAPTLFNASTSDCGNNLASTSAVKALEFSWSNNQPVIGAKKNISGVNAGSFRPSLAYNPSLRKYLIAWEDRRNANGQDYYFEVYGQLLDNNLSLLGNNKLLSIGNDYTNYDTSATWTPRPSVTQGFNNFLAAWFSHTQSNGVHIWSIAGRSISSNGTLSGFYTLAQMTLAESHYGNAPTGFLSVSYTWSTREYLLAMTNQLETVWGYLSSARVQRVDNTGQLIRLRDGGIQSQASVGSSINYQNDDQISIGLGALSVYSPKTARYLAVYSMHSRNKPSQDFDIYATQVQIQAPYSSSALLPVLLKK